jgi:hypothetical protein
MAGTSSPIILVSAVRPMSPHTTGPRARVSELRGVVVSVRASRGHAATTTQSTIPPRGSCPCLDARHARSARISRGAVNSTLLRRPRHRPELTAKMRARQQPYFLALVRLRERASDREQDAIPRSGRSSTHAAAGMMWPPRSTPELPPPT